jgi:two-component system cell cycle response regulator
MMMKSKKRFMVAVFGLSERETRVLHSIFSISTSRPRSYALADAALPDAFDIAMVNADDADALSLWHNYHKEQPTVPTLMLAKQKLSDSRHYYLHRPIIASRLLAKLDQIATEHPAFTGEGLDSASPPERVARETDGGVSPAAEVLHRTVLVVDDSLPVRKQISQVLAPLVDTVDLAESGEAGYRMLDTWRYDLVLLDVVLPGIDGYELCKRIKRSPMTKGTPVVMLTGKSSPFDRIKGKLAGCDSYLTKPVDREAFKEVIQRYLK